MSDGQVPGGSLSGIAKRFVASLAPTESLLLGATVTKSEITIRAAGMTPFIFVTAPPAAAAAARASAPPLHFKLIPCFASAEFGQIQEDGCTPAPRPARFNAAIPADLTSGATAAASCVA